MTGNISLIPAAGVPMVVSDLGALPERAYQHSFAFEAGNPRALAETLVRHLDDGPEVRSAVLRQRIVTL